MEDRILENGYCETDKKRKGETEKLRDYYINALTPSNLFMVDINVGDLTVLGMLDSGTSCSFVKRSLIDELKLDVNKNSRREIIGYGGNKVITEGEVNIKFNIENLKLSCRMNLIGNENLKFDVILGLEFLKENCVKIDFTKKKQLRSEKKIL